MSTTIVVDTSVIISALIGNKDPSREVIMRCLLGRYMPLISNALKTFVSLSLLLPIYLY